MFIWIGFHIGLALIALAAFNFSASEGDAFSALMTGVSVVVNCMMATYLIGQVV